MQNNKVYTWEIFDSFVREEFDLGPEAVSHPILDEIARDLKTGALQRRGKRGNPVQPWQLPSDLAKSFLLPSEVNACPIMTQWLRNWDPERERQLTPQEECKK